MSRLRWTWMIRFIIITTILCHHLSTRIYRKMIILCRILTQHCSHLLSESADINIARLLLSCRVSTIWTCWINVVLLLRRHLSMNYWSRWASEACERGDWIRTSVCIWHYGRVVMKVSTRVFRPYCIDESSSGRTSSRDRVVSEEIIVLDSCRSLLFCSAGRKTRVQPWKRWVH